MDEYHVNTAQSGEEEDYLWVSLHFESAAAEEDRIHIVCATFVDEQDKRLGMDAIYLERLDQSQGGYALASSIRVTSSAVEIQLTPAGLKQLEVQDSPRLLWTPALDGYEQARQHLARMTSYECGKVVQVVQF